jgi:cytochrome c553
MLGILLNNILFRIAFIALLTCSTESMSGDIKAGEARYAQNCGNCHGPGGMGLASYPKLSGKEVPYLIDRLKTYRAGTKIGPNSSLMIMMATPLSDEEIINLAAYLSNVQSK